MSDIQALNKIVQDFGKDGLRFLFLFKTLKQNVQDELKREGKRPPNEDVINEICVQTAQKLLEAGRETPTENQIRQIVLKLSGHAY